MSMVILVLLIVAVLLLFGINYNLNHMGNQMDKLVRYEYDKEFRRTHYWDRVDKRYKDRSHEVKDED